MVNSPITVAKVRKALLTIATRRFGRITPNRIEGHLAPRLSAASVKVLTSIDCNPVSIARQVLEANGPVLYAGRGAERFATARGFLPCADADLITAAAKKRWEMTRASGKQTGYAGGTVGAVAFDWNGHVAAATSTGGKMMKPRGRVGDSPILGAGTYADDTSGACSNTGDGEAFLKLCLAKEACVRMESGTDLPEAVARAVIARLGSRTDGTGGTILVDRAGRLGLARSTKTMSWAAQIAEWSEPRSGL